MRWGVGGGGGGGLAAPLSLQISCNDSRGQFGFCNQMRVRPRALILLEHQPLDHESVAGLYVKGRRTQWVLQCTMTQGDGKLCPGHASVSNHPQKDNLTISTVGSSSGGVETFLDHPHIFMTPAYGSLCSLQF